MIKPEDVRRWLEEEKLQVEEVTAPDGRWVLLVRHPEPDGPVNQIALPRERVLAVARRTEVADDHIQALRALSQTDFRRFHFHLVRDIMLLEKVGFALDISDEKRELTSFVVGREMREDQVTPDAIFEALAAVHNGSLLATIHVRRAVGVAI